jgi:hypothetical protein
MPEVCGVLHRDDIIHRIIFPAVGAFSFIALGVQIAGIACAATAVWTLGLGCAIGIVVGGAVSISTGFIVFNY